MSDIADGEENKVFKFGLFRVECVETIKLSSQLGLDPHGSVSLHLCVRSMGSIGVFKEICQVQSKQNLKQMQEEFGCDLGESIY